MRNSTGRQATVEDVVVTVSTHRYDRPHGTIIRHSHSIACGTFRDATLAALSERLQPWALGMVLRAVHARRPASGEAIEYRGTFEARPTRAQPTTGKTRRTHRAAADRTHAGSAPAVAEPAFEVRVAVRPVAEAQASRRCKVVTLKRLALEAGAA